jgi:hypothetical protein
VLADFDRAFFDLKLDEDVYADNPIHYIMGNNAQERSGNATAKYPPVIYILAKSTFVSVLTLA